MRQRAIIVCTLSILTGTAWYPAQASVEIAFGITSNTAFGLVHYVATQKKYYEAENLKIDSIVAGAAVGVVQQLAAASNAPFRVVAAKTINSWSDLKGKTISVGGLTDVTLYFLRVMARRNGLADRDYDLLYGGGTPNRFAQLASGAVAAAILTNPVDFSALEQNYVDLGSVPQYLPNWAQNNIITDTRWAQGQRAAVVGFLRARIKATNYIYEPANRDDVIATLVKYTSTTQQTAAATYDLYISQQVIAREAALAEDGITANFDALVALGDLTRRPPLANFIDGSFLAEASKP